MENFRLHSQRACGCWPTNKQGRESSVLVADTFPHFPIQTGCTLSSIHPIPQLGPPQTSLGKKPDLGTQISLDSILKSGDIILPTKVHIVKAMVFLVIVYGCESWAIKKAEHRRIDAFELWCWRRLS